MCVDGITTDPFNACQSFKQTGPWLMLDLKTPAAVSAVAIWNRDDDCCRDRLGHHQVWVGDSISGHDADEGGVLCYDGTAPPEAGPFVHPCPAGTRGRFVWLVLPGERRFLNVAEMAALGPARDRTTLEADWPELGDVVASFVDDVECSYYAPAMEHFVAQSDFVMMGDTGVDATVALETGAAAKAFAAAVGPRQHRPPAGTTGECELPHHNAASKKPAGRLPTDLESRIRGSLTPELQRRLCAVYAQDYACLGYELPGACVGLF